MRLSSWIVLASLVVSTPAAAEDFTGFYAGVNAGYARGRGTDRSTILKPPSVSGAPSESGLPPSAMSAADRMEARRKTASPGEGSNAPR